MKKRIVEDVEVHIGSGNVFADLGLADAEKTQDQNRPRYRDHKGHA